MICNLRLPVPVPCCTSGLVPLVHRAVLYFRQSWTRNRRMSRHRKRAIAPVASASVNSRMTKKTWEEATLPGEERGDCDRHQGETYTRLRHGRQTSAGRTKKTP